MRDTERTPEEIIANREHRIYATRKDKLYLNLLALAGGRPYVNERLTRFPGESSIDWGGASELKSEKHFDRFTSSVVGRKDRAYNVNHAARVAEKVRQFVMATPPERQGVGEDMLEDITRRGDSIDQFVGAVLRQIVVARWCWIGVDTPESTGPISVAAAERDKVRPYWNLYTALDVVDWRFDAKGDLEWLITEAEIFDNPDPMKESTESCVRRLWEPGRVTEYTIERGSGMSPATVVGDPRVTQLEVNRVPFILAGNISEDPHWFDDIEDVQRAILDLESDLDTLLHKQVHALPVLPESVKGTPTGETGGEQLASPAGAIIGQGYAVFEEPEEKGITRFEGPPADAIAKLQEELGRKRAVLFDTVGLHLGFTRRFSESKEATEFDHLDPQAVLRNYSQQIGEAEKKAWALTHEWDSKIPAVVPRFTDKFRVTDIYEDMKSQVLYSQLDLPDSAKRLGMKGSIQTMLEITRQNVSKEEFDALMADVDGYEFDVPIEFEPEQAAVKVADGVAKQATDDGSGEIPSGAEE